MATIEARGYASKVQTKTSKAGKTRTEFRLGVKQKERAYGDRPESVTWANFSVTDFSGQEVPEKAYVTVKGRLKVREYEVEGQKRTALEVFAESVEVAPPMDGTSASPAPKAQAASGTPEKDPWE